jgi:TonB family protein
MQNLLVEQKDKSGTLRAWRLKPEDDFQTVGSSKFAKIQLPPSAEGIEGAFQHKNGVWVYTNFNLKAESDGAEAIVSFPSPAVLKINDIQLHVTPIPGKNPLFKNFENEEFFTPAKSKHAYNLFLVYREQKLIESEIEHTNHTFKSKVTRFHLGKSNQRFNEWHKVDVDGMQVHYRTVYVKDLSEIKKTPSSEIIDEDGKKALYGTLAFSALLGLMITLVPKSDSSLDDVLAKIPDAPVVEMKMDKKEPKKEKKTAQSEPQQATEPKQNVQQQAAKRTPASKAAQGSSSVIKSLASGRISQLIGKISASAVKSKNIVIATGVPAGSQTTGRTLAAIGAINKSGRDWASEGTGTGIAVSTKGKAGGVGLGAYGKLASGKTGSGGVGLLEEEGEIIGGLDRDVIANYIKTKLGQVLYCYERQLSASPDLYGKVAIKFTIGPTGLVESQKIGESTLKNATVENCILQKLSEWKFPAPRGGTKVLVTYPFLFKSTR